MKKLNNSNVLFVTHSITSSPKDEWIDFLKQRCKRLVCIDHPFSYIKDDIRSSFAVYEHGKLIKKGICHCPANGRFSEFIFLLRDFILNIVWGLKAGKIDLCISLDPFNTFCMLLLRKIGRINKLIYYVIDYVPVRFLNKVKNSIYHFVDRRCCYNVDLIWNLSTRMQDGREINGVNLKKCAPSLIVPMGVDLSRIKPFEFSEIERQTIVYMGAFLHKQGIQLVLSVISDLIKDIPKLKFVIIGLGKYEKDMRKLINELKIEKYVDIKGYIKGHAQVEQILCKCAVGMATYRIEEDSFSYYADPGKVKVYLGCGLPVIITKFPLIAYKIEEEDAGYAIEYSAKELKEALLKLLTDDELYQKMRANAIKMSKDYNWNDICKRALSESCVDIGEEKIG